MDNAERVFACRDIRKAKAAVFLRELKPGMIEDINPGAHCPMENAADSHGMLKSAGFIERVYKFLAFDDVYIERHAAIGSHYIVEGIIAVADDNRIPCPDGERFGHELIIQLVHRVFAWG